VVLAALEIEQQFCRLTVDELELEMNTEPLAAFAVKFGALTVAKLELLPMLPVPERSNTVLPVIVPNPAVVLIPVAVASK
jgi:hypothetical protein